MTMTDNFSIHCGNCREFPNSVQVTARDDGVFVKCGICGEEELWDV